LCLEICNVLCKGINVMFPEPSQILRIDFMIS
jgi:hypothetical protein